jgi:hypothetical protein
VGSLYTPGGQGSIRGFTRPVREKLTAAPPGIYGMAQLGLEQKERRPTRAACFALFRSSIPSEQILRYSTFFISIAVFRRGFTRRNRA